MKLGERGAALIKEREKLQLVAYKPTPNDRWTIGWGHTAGVLPGAKITEDEARVLFGIDVAAAERAVNAVLSLSPKTHLSQSAFDALVSFVFNAGSAPLDATKTIGRALRDGRIFDAWAGLALYRKQDGVDLRGLARRRAEEMALFMDDPLP